MTTNMRLFKYNEVSELQYMVPLTSGNSGNYAHNKILELTFAPDGNLFIFRNSLIEALVKIALLKTIGVCSKSKPLKFINQQIDSAEVKIINS